MTGTVAQVLGVRYMATLFGNVFLIHQIGSILGVWMGGWIYDATGFYNLMWWAGVTLGPTAADPAQWRCPSTGAPRIGPGGSRLTA